MTRLLHMLALALSLAYGSASDLLAKGGSRGGSKGGQYSDGKASNIHLLTEGDTRTRGWNFREVPGDIIVKAKIQAAVERIRL